MLRKVGGFQTSMETREGCLEEVARGVPLKDLWHGLEALEGEGGEHKEQRGRLREVEASMGGTHSRTAGTAGHEEEAPGHAGPQAGPSEAEKSLKAGLASQKDGRHLGPG